MCSTTKEIWDTLKGTHEGTSQVKESKINILVHKYQLFKMTDIVTLSRMLNRFGDIINSLKALGEDIPNVKWVNKILHFLLKSWEPQVTAIIEAKDLTTLKLEQLFESLITHEMITSTDHKKKKKDLALNVSNARDDCKDDQNEKSHSYHENLDNFLLTRRKILSEKIFTMV